MIFLNGLSFKQREHASLMNTLVPEEIAQKLDNAKLIASEQQQRNSPHFQGPSHKQREKCSIHNTYFHTNAQCWEQQKKPRNLHVSTTKDLTYVNINFEGTKTLIPALIDTGADRVFVNPDLLDIELKTEKNEPILTTFGNNDSTFLNEKAKLRIIFPEADPHTIYKIDALVWRDLPVPILLGRTFLESHKVLIDCSSKEIQINGYKIHFTSTSIERSTGNVLEQSKEPANETQEEAQKNEEQLFKDKIRCLIHEFNQSNPKKLSLFLQNRSRNPT